MKLVHASISENNSTGWYDECAAGDQTGKEVCVREWYNKPWDIMIRYPDTEISKKASSGAVKLANSNLVGYDQSQRNTLYSTLKKFDFNIDEYIKSGIKTETDCSAFIYAVYSCFVPVMRSNSNAPTTFTMEDLYKKWGFVIHTGNKYLNGNDVMPGDIMVNIEHHTAMVTDGKTGITEPIIEIPIYNNDIKNAIDVLARDVIKGNWGNGNDRKEKLYVAIQTRVNEILK